MYNHFCLFLFQSETKTLNRPDGGCMSSQLARLAGAVAPLSQIWNFVTAATAVSACGCALRAVAWFCLPDGRASVVPLSGVPRACRTRWIFLVQTFRDCWGMHLTWPYPNGARTAQMPRPTSFCLFVFFFFNKRQVSMYTSRTQFYLLSELTVELLLPIAVGLRVDRTRGRLILAVKTNAFWYSPRSKSPNYYGFNEVKGIHLAQLWLKHDFIFKV